MIHFAPSLLDLNLVVKQGPYYTFQFSSKKDLEQDTVENDVKCCEGVEKQAKQAHEYTLHKYTEKHSEKAYKTNPLIHVIKTQ